MPNYYMCPKKRKKNNKKQKKTTVSDIHECTPYIAWALKINNLEAGVQVCY